MTDDIGRKCNQTECLAYDLVDDWYIRHHDVTANVEQRKELITLITVALFEAERRGMERAAGICEKHGVYPEMNVYDGGPSWYKHQKAIAATIRAQAQAGEEG